MRRGERLWLPSFGVCAGSRLSIVSSSYSPISFPYQRHSGTSPATSIDHRFHSYLKKPYKASLACRMRGRARRSDRRTSAQTRSELDFS